MYNLKNFDELNFKNRKDKKAYVLIHKAIKRIGNITKVAEIIDCTVSYMSSVAWGRKRLSKGGEVREQIFLSPEKAVALSKAVDYEIRAEDFVPNHDFSYMFEYVKEINKRNK